METFDIGGELTVDRLGFGAMRLTGYAMLGEPDDLEAARAVLRRAGELVDLIDTADSYGPGVSERLISDTLVPYDDVVVATKGGLLRNNDGDWIPRGDHAHLRNAVLCSRDRLRVDTIDLYQLHRPDPDVDFLESVTTMAELADDGLISHVGVSQVTLDQLEAARDHVEVATVQNRFNIADQSAAPLVDACEEYDIGFVPWQPIAAGDLDEIDELEVVAARHDATPVQIALAWLLEYSNTIIPIPGTSTIDHLKENSAAAKIDLTPTDLDRLS